MSFLIQQTLLYAVPLMIVALAGVFAERSGIINLALEGIMIFGAFIGVLFVRSMQSFDVFTGQGHNHQGYRVQKGLLNQKTHACAPPSLVVLGSFMGGSALALVSPLRGLPVIMARITREKALR